MLNKITETSLKHSGTFLGNLFETVGTFQSLKGHVDSIAILHRNREYIIEMTQKAIKGIQMGQITDATSYLQFLKYLGNLNATSEFFAHIRVLHATAQGGKDAYAVTLEAMDDVQKLLGYQELPGVKEFDPVVVENIRTLFQMLSKRRVIIEDVINKQTSTFSSTSSIIEHFNESLAQYDMFGVNRNADIRYENTRAEMLLALDEIAEIWAAQKRNRDKWIDENKQKYIHKYVPELRIQWAKQTKSDLSVSLQGSLKTRIANFIEKLKVQIALREALQGGSELSFLDAAVRQGTVPGTNKLFDFDADFFCSHGRNIVNKYY